MGQSKTKRKKKAKPKSRGGRSSGRRVMRKGKPRRVSEPGSRSGTGSQPRGGVGKRPGGDGVVQEKAGGGDGQAAGRHRREPDYYDILGVRKDGSPEEIRASFRRLAKKYHPDRNSGRAKWAEQKIRLIIQAYDTLMDRDSRSAYDRRLRQETDPDEDAYRQSLRQREGDPYAEARLILEDLLNERGDEALEVYEKATMRGNGGFELSSYLDCRDYLDCLFLLGEEYERAGDWKRALEFYHQVYDLEHESPTRFFLETLKERIRDIYCKKLARRSSPLDAVEVYEKVLLLGIPKKTEAYIHKKIAEALFRAGHHKKARQHLTKAFTLEPKLKGAQKICEKLGLDIKRERTRAARAAARG